MPIMIPAKDVQRPQHLRSVVTPVGGEGSLVLDVYSGWLVFDFGESSGNLRRDTIFSWVPLGSDPNQGGHVLVQGYETNVVNKVVTASISSVGDGPSAAAVDEAFINGPFPQAVTGVTTKPCLVLVAGVAVQRGSLHRISYQVTVLAETKALGKDIGIVHSIDAKEVLARIN